VRALPDAIRKRRGVTAMRHIGGEKFMDLLRLSERQIYRWHNASAPAERSSLLNLYFRIFRCE
jgi:hypothetical protein